MLLLKRRCLGLVHSAPLPLYDRSGCHIRRAKSKSSVADNTSQNFCATRDKTRFQVGISIRERQSRDSTVLMDCRINP